MNELQEFISKIKEINVLSLKEDDVIIIKCDFGKLPPIKVREMAKSILNNMEHTFKDNKILIFDKKTDIQVFGGKEE